MDLITRVVVVFLSIVSCSVASSGTESLSPTERISPLKMGIVTTNSVSGGSFLYYLPKNGAKRILIVCHGMFAKDKTAEDAARATLRHWKRLSEKYRVLVIAPIFDNENFAATKPGALGGYRTLTGRQIGADDFVHKIIDSVRLQLKKLPKKFFLFGHSAGAQFANRYLVRHPIRLAGALISAPAWFAFPDPNDRWPYGMQPRKGNFKWGNTGERVLIDVKTKRNDWVIATKVPTQIIVGALDTKPIKKNKPDNHLSQAKKFVAMMNDLAKKEGHQTQISLHVVEGVGHNLGKLTRAGASFLESLWSRN